MPSFLIVEDDREMLATLRAVFQEEGYEAMRANNYNSAREKITIYTPFILLTDFDLQSPNGDGGDLVKLAQKHGCQNTILWSGLDRTRELDKRGIAPSWITTKDNIGPVIEYVNQFMLPRAAEVDEDDEDGIIDDDDVLFLDDDEVDPFNPREEPIFFEELVRPNPAAETTPVRVERVDRTGDVLYTWTQEGGYVRDGNGNPVNLDPWRALATNLNYFTVDNTPPTGRR